MGTWPYNAQTVDVAPRTGGHFGGLPTTQPSGCKAGLSETGEISACSLVSHWELTVLSLSQNRSWPLTAGYPWSTCTRCSAGRPLAVSVFPLRCAVPPQHPRIRTRCLSDV